MRKGGMEGEEGRRGRERARDGGAEGGSEGRREGRREGGNLMSCSQITSPITNS